MEVTDLLQQQVSISMLPPLPLHCYFYTRLKYGHGSHWLYHIQAFGKLGLLWAFFWQSFPWLEAHHTSSGTRRRCLQIQVLAILQVSSYSHNQCLDYSSLNPAHSVASVSLIVYFHSASFLQENLIPLFL